MISLNWVKDYINLDDEDLSELAVKITKAGVNVEKVITNHIDNLVIGQILECINHPDSDHLHICSVDVGNEVKQIVCGASNVRKGLKVIVALPGAVLPGNFTIKKGVIRGQESDGMICALFELGLEEKTEETYNKGIYELDDNAKVGTDPLKYLGIDDTLYELDVHKHRNNDCYYHIGFAYEIGSILNRKVTLPSDSYSEISDNINSHFNLEVDTKKCPYYLAKMVTDVKIGESPEFIKKRLAASGMRSINNVVDISNYVMLEYGQPMHFFDKDKLGDKIVVRDALDGELIITLDGKERVLKSSDIVITDGVKPVCIAGVMGGENTEVDQNTKNILIESAIFDATSIIYTANSLNLKSEASIRYGKGLNYEYTLSAINRACHLLEKYAGAKILTGIVKHDIIDKTPKTVTFMPDAINKLLGIKVSESDMEVELNRLDFSYELKNGKFIVTIPNRRLDIDPNVNDIAEEIGRLYGYHNLVSTLPISHIKKGSYSKKTLFRKLISKRMRSIGLNEVLTYTLVSPEESTLFKYHNGESINLLLPMSADKSVIRQTLMPSLLKVIDYNLARNIKDINIYEISNVYYKKDNEYIEGTKLGIAMLGNYITNTWQNNSIEIDFYVIKGIAENLLNYLGYSNRYNIVKSINLPCEMHPGISAEIMVDNEVVGYIGRVHPNVSKLPIYVGEISLDKLYSKKTGSLKYKESPKFPSMSRDMAFIIDKNIEASDVIKVIKKTGGKILDTVDVFDVYVGENIGNDKKSLAFALTFQDINKTLTDDEVNAVFNNIISEVEARFNATLRNK
jgi:phenylalanyl-tRNA synthetase beta chain